MTLIAEIEITVIASIAEPLNPNRDVVIYRAKRLELRFARPGR